MTRIEPYGCFVRLIPSNNSSSSPSISISGLVHISQLYSSKVANVSDIVSLNDTVWVKVIDIQVETITDDETGRTRPRHKVKLSMKYVNQETGQDLDPENELFEEDRQRQMNSGNNSGRGVGGNEDGGANSLLGRALVSNIGMSTAMDPGNLILRGTTSRGAAAAASSSFNGYALVGDDEGESSPPPPPPVGEPSASLAANTVIPMGRGRGMTLPAWMTKIDTEDRLGSAQGAPSNDNNDLRNDDNTEKRHRRDKRQHHHHTSVTKERHYKHSSSRKVHKHERRRRRRGRSHSISSSYSSNESRNSSPSPSSSSSSEYRSRSRSVERHSSRSRSSHPRKKGKSHKHDKHRKHHRRSRQDREYSRSRSRSPSRRHRALSSEFANVEEARAIVERLERRR